MYYRWMRLWFLIILFLFFPLYSFSANKCSADDLLKKSCDFYQKNKAKEFIKTSDGRQYSNPAFRSKLVTILQGNQTMIQQPTNPYQGNPEAAAIHFNAILEFEIEADAIIDSSTVSSLPAKSVRAIKSNAFINELLRTTFPGEKCCNRIQKPEHLLAPFPFDRLDAKVVTISDDQVKEIRDKIGPEKMQQLKEAALKSQSIYQTIVPKGEGDSFTYEHYNPPEDVPFTEERIKAEKARIERLGRYAREQIVSLIKMGRSDQQLSEEQKNLVKKIETTEFFAFNSPLVSQLAACENEYAMYFPTHHILVICKNLLDLPDSQLVYVIGHELGHSIDPCRSESLLTKVNQEKLDQAQRELELAYPKNTNNFESTEDSYSDNTNEALASTVTKFGKTAAHAYLEALIKGLPKSDVTYNNNSSRADWNADLNKEVKQSGILEVVANGVPAAKHPFETVRSCLVREENIDDISHKDLEAAWTVEEAYNKRSGMPTTKKDQQQFMNDAKKNKYCTGTSLKHSEVAEAMSDFYGAFAMSKYLNDFKCKTEEDCFGAVSFFTNGACQVSDESIYKNNYENKSESSYLESSGSGDGTNSASPDKIAAIKSDHPNAKRRLLTIAFKMPGIAEHFGCELQPKSKCFTNQEFFLKSPSVRSEMEKGQK